MSTEPSVEEVSLEQRATDPRLEQQVEPVVEPTVEPAATTEEPTLEAEPEPAKPPKKTAEEVLKGRVGHLTKTLSAKDEAIAAAEARAAAAEALLAANAPTTTTTEATKPSNVYTQEDFDKAVQARAEVQEFNRRADEMYNTGASKYTDWKDAVDTLVVSGFMNKDLIDAAMAVEDGTAVLHHLGNNLDEAERISALPPIQKAAQMAKLSNSLNTVRSTPVSSAPAPIKPVAGSPSPTVDLQRLSDDGDMAAYIAARAKQGSRWANGRR